MEAKLAEFRARKAAEKLDQERKDRIWDTLTLGFVRRRVAVGAVRVASQEQVCSAKLDHLLTQFIIDFASAVP